MLTFRAGKQAFSQGAKIEPRPTCNDRDLSAIRNVAQSSSSGTAISSCRKRLIGISNVNDMMRKTRLLSRRGLSATQIHAPIYGHRVAADNLSLKAFAEHKRESSFATPGWPQQQDYERF